MIKELIRIAEHYGPSNQSRQLIEEMAELTQALCKAQRVGTMVYNRENIIEEIADVEVMLYQMKHLLGCHEEVTRIKQEKIARQIARIEEEVR